MIAMAVEDLQPETCSRYLKALADAERLRIVAQLLAGPHSVGALAEAVGLSVANASHHLKVMREAGLVVGEPRGRFVVYRLSDQIARRRRGRALLDFGCCRIDLGGGG